MPEHKDAFKEARQKDGILNVDADGETVPFLLRLKDVRKAAKDYKNFSSDHPLMVILHSEKDLRSVRQLPIEIDPPDQTDYRAIVEPLFKQPTESQYIENIETLIDQLVDEAIQKETVEIVHDFALPLQSHALTRLFRMPESEAEQWISWGIHVFYDHDGNVREGHYLQNYSQKKFEEAEQNPGDDFFSLLNQADFRGRKLTLEEKLGYASVALSGGRDTIIYTISSIIAHLGDHPEALEFLREDETRFKSATEEFVRYVSPLTMISRTCPHAAEVNGHEFKEKTRVGLCWPSANRDETVFENPDEIKLDRCPNPHIGFGFGAHNCLGAPHARLIIRSLLKSLCQKIDHIELIEAIPKMETEASYERQTGYESVTVKFIGK